MKTSTEDLIKAMLILVRDIQSEDGVANAAIAEAANRLDELQKENIALHRENVRLLEGILNAPKAVGKELDKRAAMGRASRETNF